MKHSSSRELFRYWTALRGERAAPAREEIDPGAMRRVLGDSFILSVESAASTKVRLAGTRVCALFCREIKSAPFLQFWAPESRLLMRSLMHQVVEESTAIVAGCLGQTRGEPPLPLELLVLPLARGQARRARIIGILAPLARAYWIGITPIQTIALGTFRHVDSETPARMRPRRLLLSSTLPADVPLAAAPPYAQRTQAPHLVVYEGGAASHYRKDKIPAGD